WAVDLSAPVGSGISGVQVAADAQQGAGTILGTASQGPRPDVDAALGRSGSFGFTLNSDLSGLSTGPHTLSVTAMTSCGPATATVPITVQSNPGLLNIDSPSNGATVSSG